MKIRPLTRNVFFNVLKTSINLVFPLIIFPYVTRVLKVDNLGKVTFAQSIVNYFQLLAMLGIGTYAVREGAKVRHDKFLFEKFSNEVIRINIVSTLISYIILFLSIYTVPKMIEYRWLIILISLSILFNTLGFEWINIIYEEYFIITIRSILLQLVSILFLIIFVKNENDYYAYAFLTVFSNICISIWNFIYCRKYFRFRINGKYNYTQHLKAIFLLFANNLSITIYTNSDSTMLGWMLSDYYVGIYALSLKIYSIFKSVFAAIYIVFIPRLSSLNSQKSFIEFKKVSNNILILLVLILVPAMVGVAVLAKHMIIFLSGAKYLETVLTLQILSIGLVFAIVGGFLSNCLAIPMGKEKLVLTATLIAAGSNIFLNLLLIPLLKHHGAAISTVIAELVVLVVCINDKEIRKIFDWSQILNNLFLSFQGSFIIVLLYNLIVVYIKSDIFICILTFMISITLYFMLLVYNKKNLLEFF